MLQDFYAFWFKFDSWRDFSSYGKHNIDAAEEREEKRWMQRENEREASKAKRAEVQRVWNLVSRAYGRDPRVVAMKAAEEEAKRAAKDARHGNRRALEEAARKAAEEAAAAAAEAEARAAEEAAIAKVAREKEKKAMRNAKSEARGGQGGGMGE